MFSVVLEHKNTMVQEYKLHVRMQVCLSHLLFTKSQKYILGEGMKKKTTNNQKQTALAFLFISLT